MCPKNTGEVTGLRITGELNIYRAGELKQTLLEALSGARAVDIDLSQVDEIDSAGVQLIVATRKQAYVSGKGLRIVDHSPAVAQAIELLGLDTCLGIGPVACARCDSLEKCHVHTGAGQ